jgi:heme exporter protein A
VIFQNVNIALAAGQAVHLTGPNGVGKTSLLRLCAGALVPSNGHVYLADPDRVFLLPADDRAITGQRSVFSFLAFWAKLWAVPENNIAPALEQMGMTTLGDQRLGHLSAGQKRRLQWARLLLQQQGKTPATAWLLDEPFKGLDRAAMSLCEIALAQHMTSGGGALIASHEPLPAIAHSVVPLMEAAP